MDLVLVRRDSNPNGIFSDLNDGDGKRIAETLEHAYLINGTYQAKIPVGTYTCVRGAHRLEGMSQDFITFEVTGVVNHQNILFHCGNTEKDSSGCILLGEARTGDMVTNSKITFAKFLHLQDGLDKFQLIVI